MRRYAVLIALALPLTAHAQGVRAVKPLPGLVCMLTTSEGVRSFADLPQVKAEPSVSSATIGLAGSIVFAKVPRHEVNGFVEITHMDGHAGWLPANQLRPYRSTSNPSAHCTPSLMSDGKLGIG